MKIQGSLVRTVSKMSEYTSNPCNSLHDIDVSIKRGDLMCLLRLIWVWIGYDKDAFFDRTTGEKLFGGSFLSASKRNLESITGHEFSLFTASDAISSEDLLTVLTTCAERGAPMALRWSRVTEEDRENLTDFERENFSNEWNGHRVNYLGYHKESDMVFFRTYGPTSNATATWLPKNPVEGEDEIKRCVMNSALGIYGVRASDLKERKAANERTLARR